MDTYGGHYFILLTRKDVKEIQIKLKTFAAWAISGFLEVVFC